MKVLDRTFKVKHITTPRGREYIMDHNGQRYTIYKQGRFYKPVGRQFPFFHTLREAMFHLMQG
ncbi:hypothetical protein NVP1238A_73 [Vibrio phage 1.238.A._10N.261.52.F10]|uniref:Uncharacterized protein n=2 Tax=Pariacacavirus TaxID=2948856 RepID=A0A2I7RUH4_9CAUD|nr:hypothetical protein KNT79_gp73 [Vibrio phage 1.238.A._10N.261.52.F10]YP_010093518.1 hypothetical protein KNT80_gp75 [Vibrio phage 1.245.O._10N.261.54.C7]AUR97322.1 hypothetical protein NVP1238A_73 [Vibrio phage 1.238.A._10N.261.52.F10]AUR97416.1 hypothetical protein NVP1238B_74 [Vibrio phage 1.238.B._10N.261.52.F10]AUR97988.1 hypothetical protein NVP1245O_75 [Vibrio phage 1.245.O._10N.261.54.C7]